MLGYKAIPLIWQIFIGQNRWPYKREALYKASGSVPVQNYVITTTSVKRKRVSV